MTDMTNPKDLLGAKKIDLSLFPDVAVLHGAHAMFDGAGKYGPYNWRTKHVRATVYITAARRHLLAWAAGEEYAEDSGVHHLGHVLGCVAILLDAQTTGALLDDRHTHSAVVKLLADLNYAVASRAKKPEDVEALVEAVTETASEIDSVETLLTGLEDIAFREVPGPEAYRDPVYDLSPLHIEETLMEVARQEQQAETRRQAFERPVAWDEGAQGNQTDPDEPWVDDEPTVKGSPMMNHVPGVGGVRFIPYKHADGRLVYPDADLSDPETDTEATEAVDWDSFPPHPDANNVDVLDRVKGYDGLHEGDVCFDYLANRMCRIDRFIMGGREALVVYRLRSGFPAYGTTRTNTLELVGQMVAEVATHGEDRDKESGK